MLSGSRERDQCWTSSGRLKRSVALWISVGPVQMVALCVGRKASTPICSHTTELQSRLTQCNNTNSPRESRKTEKSPDLLEGRKEAVNDAPNWFSDS